MELNTVKRPMSEETVAVAPLVRSLKRRIVLPEPFWDSIRSRAATNSGKQWWWNTWRWCFPATLMEGKGSMEKLESSTPVSLIR